MTDRLTDAELDEVVNFYGSDDPHLGGVWHDTQVCALVAEVREHRAARTLTDDERKWVELWRGSSAARELIAIIDRITADADRD